MKLPDFNKEPNFQRLLKDMGAKKIPIALIPKPQDELSYKNLTALTTIGLNTELKNININHESYITHKDIKIIAYHPVNTLYHIFKYFMNSSFHIAACRHIKAERLINPQNNYLIYAGYNEITSMTVCNDCLVTTNWKDYNNASHAHKSEIIKNFNVAEFLDFTYGKS
jgi:hypothetical protein